jgi:DNA invertase Pin-like site-specific DNA recombinase
VGTSFNGRQVVAISRLSTDKQTVDNQVRELTAIAERRGWQIVDRYHDAGISGPKGRKDGPGVDQMLMVALGQRGST